MALSEPEFTVLVDGGCSCGGGELLVEAWVTQRLDLYRGDVLGSPKWGYKGEELVQGTFSITCTRCKKSLYETDACPRCGTAGGIERAFETETDFMADAECGACQSVQLTLSAYVPARVVYGNGRALKARSNIAPEDEGFHAFKVECKICHDFVHRRGACVLCGHA